MVTLGPFKTSLKFTIKKMKIVPIAVVKTKLKNLIFLIDQHSIAISVKNKIIILLTTYKYQVICSRLWQIQNLQLKQLGEFLNKQ